MPRVEQLKSIGIIGLGYVGLPLARSFCLAGHTVIGFDIDDTKVKSLQAGRNYLQHLGQDYVRELQQTGRFQATGDFTRLQEADAILICVPTPLGPHLEPNLSYVEQTTDAVAATLRAGQLVVLESGLRPIRLALDSRAAREATEWFVELQTVHGVAPDALAEMAESSESRFLNGRTAMFLNSRRGTPTARAVDGLDWDVAALPTTVEPAGILHSDAYCMAAATEDKDAAWTFIEFANSPTGQAIVAESGRTVPSLIEVASSDAFLDPSVAPANSKVWLETVDTLGTVPVMAAWVDIEELTGDELERAFYGQAPVDEVIDSMIARTAPFFAGEEG